MTIHRVHFLSVAMACAVAALGAGAGCGGNTPGAGQASDAAADHSAASGGSGGSGSGGSSGGGSGGPGGSGGQTDGGAADAGQGCEPGTPVGTIRPAGDGCNSCICSVGNFWACTTAFCQPDASTPSDASSGSGGRAVTGGRGGGGNGGSGGNGGNGGGATGGSGGAGGGRASCAAAEMLSRSCTNDTECVAVYHATDCCGSLRVMGLRTTELDQFRGLESQCGASYPACECAPRPTLTDDGSAIRAGTNVGIGCLGGVCTTFHSACGRPCTDGRVCATCASGPTIYAACTTSCDRAACTDVGLTLCQTAFHGDRMGMYCTAAGIACGTP